MRAIILAGGYATRLYPLTLDRPKHLLEVGGRPILDLLLDRLPLAELDAVYVVTNAKFADRFREWARTYPVDVVVIDDGTTSEDDRLGAIGDLQLAIDSEGLDDDLIVAAGDSIFTERLDGFARFGQERGAAAIAVYDVGDLEAMKRLASIGVDADSRLVSFEEKPEDPQSTLAGIALYFYPRAVLPLIREYLAEENNPDQPGRLVGWLYRRTPVYAWRVPGRWFDIGTPETLDEASELFGSGSA
ncbi:MAG TPA: nucleotidyltransferase family protein [Gaiellaceae bacterium]|nr:nucleotidyltransferase family protein [Gaiellaceae bacterium]